MGFTTTYFKNASKGIGRLGVIYFKCGAWTPPPTVIEEPEKEEEDEVPETTDPLEDDIDIITPADPDDEDKEDTPDQDAEES